MHSLKNKVLDKRFVAITTHTLTKLFLRYKNLKDFRINIELDQKNSYTVKISAKLYNLYHEKMAKSLDLKKSFELATDEFQKNLQVQLAFVNYKKKAN